MKKIIIFLLGMLILSLQAMEQEDVSQAVKKTEENDKVVSLKEQSAKKLAASDFSDYQKLPDQATRELVFNYKNQTTLNFADLKKFLEASDEFSESFAQALALLIQNDLFEAELDNIIALFQNKPGLGQIVSKKYEKSLQKALADLYVSNNKKFKKAIGYQMSKPESDTFYFMGVPLDFWYFKARQMPIPFRGNLPLEMLIVFVWIQQIEKKLIKEYPFDPNTVLQIQAILFELTKIIQNFFPPTFHVRARAELLQKIELLKKFVEIARHKVGRAYVELDNDWYL